MSVTFLLTWATAGIDCGCKLVGLSYWIEDRLSDRHFGPVLMLERVIASTVASTFRADYPGEPSERGETARADPLWIRHIVEIAYADARVWNASWTRNHLTTCGVLFRTNKSSVRVFSTGAISGSRVVAVSVQAAPTAAGNGAGVCTGARTLPCRE